MTAAERLDDLEAWRRHVLHALERIADPRPGDVAVDSWHDLAFCLRHYRRSLDHTPEV